MTFFPISIFKVRGRSMLPSFREGDYLLVCNIAYLLSSLKKGDVVIARHPSDKQLILKRILKIKDKKYFLAGDNQKDSSDSKNFGKVNRKSLVGKVFFKISG